MTASDHPRTPPLRIPFRLQVVYGSRKFYTGFSLALAVLCFYGPIPARLADHNAYRYLLGPLVCTCLALGLHLLFPYNPYGSRSPRDRGLRRLDERDAGARRFRELLRSDGCRQVAVAAAGRWALVLTAIMGALAALVRRSLTWSLVSPNLVMGLSGGLLFTWLLIRIAAITWALDTWQAETEAANAP